MKVRSIRFKVRSAMIAVAIAAVFLACERLLFQFAEAEARLESDHYTWAEVTTLWLFLNLALLILLVLVGVYVSSMLQSGIGARTRIR
jgi:hypothetical protein